MIATIPGHPAGGHPCQRGPLRLLAVASLCFVIGAAPAPAQTDEDAQALLQKKLQQKVEDLRSTHGLPAVGAAVVGLDGEPVIAVTGHRTAEGEHPVEPVDLWHIGSVTKSFTATLVARLIEARTPLPGDPPRTLDWSTPLGALLPAARGTAFEEATVRQLLGHRSGLQPNPDMSFFAMRGSDQPLREQREEVVASLLETEPQSPPGTAMLYSNAGYVLLGSALEHLLDRPWEEALRAQVLGPLGLESAGFGPPGSAGVVDQPRGHHGSDNAELVPVEPGPFADNPAFLGPAGTLHMNLADLAAYAHAHLAGENGAEGILTPESFRHLHRNLAGQAYAQGWVRIPAEEGAPIPGPVIWHNGSNSLWYAYVALAPEAGLAVATVTNAGIHNAQTMNGFGLELLRAFLPEDGANRAPDPQHPEHPPRNLP